MIPLQHINGNLEKNKNSLVKIIKYNLTNDWLYKSGVNGYSYIWIILNLVMKLKEIISFAEKVWMFFRFIIIGTVISLIILMMWSKGMKRKNTIIGKYFKWKNYYQFLTYSLFGKNLTINPENLNIGLLLNDFKSLHNNSYYNFF